MLDAAARDLRRREVVRLVADRHPNEEIGERVDLCALTGTSRPEVVH